MMKTNNKKKGNTAKKLIPAAMMLAVSASMLATSTYAWFSMNKTVTVNSMQITAKSNNAYLLIGTDTNDTATEIQGINPIARTIALTVADGDSAKYPSKPKEASEIGTGKLFETGTPVTDYASAASQANWYTAQNDNPAASTDSVKNQTSLSAANFGDYVIKKTVYLTLAEGSNNANTLTVTPTIALKSGEAGTDISAVKVLVVTDDDNIVTLTSSTSGAQSLHAVTDTTLTDSDVVTVDIYIYYDGSEAAVTTNDIADLAAATISLNFDVEPITS